MKYMLLAYTKQADWEAVDVTSPDFIAMCEFYADLERELTESGELLMTEGLADPSLTRTVRKEAVGTVAMDGPYAEAKEVLASFSVLECSSHDRAVAIAARIADAVGDAVEVRPLMSGAAPDLP